MLAIRETSKDLYKAQNKINIFGGKIDFNRYYTNIARKIEKLFFN
jgi:hypothetical protein